MVVLKQGFGNYIIRTADRESSVRTIFQWKMCVVRHQDFRGRKLFIFPSLPWDDWRQGSLVVCSPGHQLQRNGKAPEQFSSGDAQQPPPYLPHSAAPLAVRH